MSTNTVPGLEVRSQGTRPVPFKAERRPSQFRHDIQALRALAVILVVVGHLWPKSLTGGYVGVDVFFVISGFLITSHLSKEVLSSARLDFSSFYSRRVRRLLPAAFLVSIISLVAAYFILPFSRWGDTAQEVIASIFYAENWLLASKSVDYSASTASATVAQHYWSLSVEEQFYLVWPLFLVALAALAPSVRVSRRTLVLVGICAASAASFAVSAHLAEAGAPEAYFFTHGRLWEFGVGGALALMSPFMNMSRRIANVIAMAGFFALLWCSVAYSSATPFPGSAALIPVLGTALVIASGTPGHNLWHRRLTSAYPVQFIGNVSYSLYLWHWPLIVFGPFLFNAELRTPSKLVLLAVSVVLAWLTKVSVEDWGISWKPKSRPVARTFLFTGTGMVLIVALAAGLLAAHQTRVSEAEQLIASQGDSACYGPGAMDLPIECTERFGPAHVPTMSEANAYYETPGECSDNLNELMAGDKRTTRHCDFTEGSADAETVWLVGDSHAQQWQAPVFELARRHNWMLKVSFLGACPPAEVSYVGYYNARAEPSAVEGCESWGRAVSGAVIADKPAYVFTSSFSRKESVDDNTGRSQIDQYIDGFGAYWKPWMANGSNVVVLADPPYNVDVRTPDCAQLNAAEPLKCAVNRSDAAPVDPMVRAAERLQDPLLKLVDLTDYFCDSQRCFSVVGGVVVYFDANHLNGEFSRLLAPMIEERIAGR
ncbi:acyltransferase family protein [Pseudarthrobacter sp. Y6]|uniref:acyltransferase family protein n=1 Tax=Pseudarthrobacter sp. Y6 TaxID=3418422 RepID=UPI003CF5BCE9